MRQQSSGIYNVYLSKKTNKVDIYHNNTRQTIFLKKHYMFLTFANKNLFKCLHLLISSDFLFRRSLLLINLIIHSFSVRYNWQIIELGFPPNFDAIEYLMEKLMLLRFRCQIDLANSVLFSYFLCLKSLVWFQYLSLKGVSAKAKWNFLPLFASLETSAL